jgi:hypothetical protein
MCAYELYEHATERERYVDDKPVFVAAEIKYDPVVSHEIDRTSELPLYFGRIGPTRLGYNRKPSTNRALSVWVTRPEILQGPTGDHLHESNFIMSPIW